MPGKPAMKLLLSLVTVLLTALPAFAPAADLTRIERRLLREPVYKGRPKYCLLVFGPQAKTRVWLVQDGDTLYVDKNGNGDLTEPGEKIAAEKREGADEGEYTFKVREIRDGTRLHKELTVWVAKIDYRADQDDSVKALLAKNPKARGYGVMAEVEMPGWKGAALGGRVQQRVSYIDVNGVLQFGNEPQEAPVIHFGGPWQVTLFGRHKFIVGRPADLCLGVGTAGVGPGTTAWVDYEGVIPENAYPIVEITYAPKQPGLPPVRERHELKHRC